jgi:hypothetical protein
MGVEPTIPFTHVHALNVSGSPALWIAHRSQTREPLVGPGGIVGYPIGLCFKATS